MPKSNLIRNVEEIADRISRKNIKESRAIVQLGTWIKNLVDDIKGVKQRLDELDIRIRKINAYGATVLTPSEAESEQQATANPAARVKPGELKRYRMSRHLSQAALGALFGVAQQKYARWEAGKSIMISSIEDRFREIQGLTGSELRTKLQGLGFFQATGKKTRFLKGQGENQPAPKPAREIRPAIITKAQLRELRLELGYTHRQMAELANSKPKHYSNWEYGACLPPEKIARKLLAMYNEHVAKTAESASAGSYHRPTSNRKIYESELLPIAKIRAGRAASGLTCKKIAERLGVPLTTYRNWETGNARPSPQNVEKMIQIFGTPPTASVKAATKKNAAKTNLRTKHEDGYAIPFDEVKALRAKLGLSYSQMGTLLDVKGNCYHNWETCGRGVPKKYVPRIKMLQSLSQEKLQRLYAEYGISVPVSHRGQNKK